MRVIAFHTAFLLLLASPSVDARILRVGPSKALAVPSQAAAIAQHGDTIDIASGEYVDCATWNHDNLLLRGKGGYAHVRDRACVGKAIWIIRSRNTTVEWIEFSGASVPDKNGAGIRKASSSARFAVSSTATTAGH